MEQFLFWQTLRRVKEQKVIRVSSQFGIMDSVSNTWCLYKSLLIENLQCARHFAKCYGILDNLVIGDTINFEPLHIYPFSCKIILLRV